MRCPALIGRDPTVAASIARLERAASGAGGLLLIVGDAGVGKTSLLARLVEAARASGMFVLSGRAAESPNPVAYRPLSEAFFTAFRSTPPPDDASLDGFRGHLGRLVPAWAGSASVDADSPLMVGEAIIRLLRLSAPPSSGALLVIEDAHWADPETIAILEYLVDAAAAERVLCVATTRPGVPLADVAQRLARIDPASVISVAPLDMAGVERMLAACLGVIDPPAGLADFVAVRSEGNPFLVEELLAGLVATGDLRRQDEGWEISELRATVPASWLDSIERRVDRLGGGARRVIGAAAMLGREFSWELLPGIAGVDGRAVLDALRAAVREQLIDPAGSGFAFHHALTRDGVLATLLPPERAELAELAWPVVERANPGLPGSTLELAAELAEAAGDPLAAGRLLLDSARRALDAGALATAEATARRARRLVHGTHAATDGDLMLVDVLVAAGKVTEAMELGLAVSRRADVDPAARRRMRLTVARAAITAGDLGAAHAAISAARIDDDSDTVGELDVLEAHVALDSGRLDEAVERAGRACEMARRAGRPEIECDALIVIGRATRSRSWPESAVYFAEARAIAQAEGLASWHLRAQRELSLGAWTTGDLTPLQETRALAVRYGALDTVAVVDLTLADIALGTFDTGACLSAATACATASRRYRLATASVASLWLAGAHALAGDDDAMQAAISDALAADADDARILGDLYGRVLPARALVRDELDTLMPLLETMAEHVARAPHGTSVFPGRILRAVLCAVDGSPRAAEARAAVDEMAASGMQMFLLAQQSLAAIEAGRRGDRDRATTLFESAHRQMTEIPLGAGQMHALVPFIAPAAARDGWGEPARWLRGAEAFFLDMGHPRVARRCRLILAEIGAPVPRTRGDTAVPAELRARGVTGREVQVLQLVVAGRTNREIAEALVLSPKTVERHLSSLFSKLDVSNRTDLGRLARPVVGEGGGNP